MAETFQSVPEMVARLREQAAAEAAAEQRERIDTPAKLGEEIERRETHYFMEAVASGRHFTNFELQQGAWPDGEAARLVLVDVRTTAAHDGITPILPVGASDALSDLAELKLWCRRGKPKKRNRRSPRHPKMRPLTVPQTAAIQIVGECKGNIAEAARRLGKDRKTVEESYRTGLLKLNKTTHWNKGKTRLLPRDRRGQEVVNDTDDRRRS